MTITHSGPSLVQTSHPEFWPRADIQTRGSTWAWWSKWLLQNTSHSHWKPQTWH